jgi:hypothetical protein
MLLQFKQSKYPISTNSFITDRHTKLEDTIKNFAYVTRLPNKRLIAKFYVNFTYIKSILLTKENKKNYKAVQPFCVNGKESGEIWRNAYQALVNELSTEHGFSKIQTKTETFKRKIIIGDKATIISAKIVLSLNLSPDNVTGKIVDIDSMNNYYLELPHPIDISQVVANNKTDVVLKRCELERVDGDEYQLINVICSICNK